MVVEDKLVPCQQLDFIRAEGELKCGTLCGLYEVLCTSSEPVKNCMGELGLPKYVGMLGWFKWVGMLGWLQLAFRTAWTCLFMVRPGVLNKILSHICGKLTLPIYLFKVGLFTLINMHSLIFLGQS